ncbi:MAG: MFS transporter, partial [Candidatus Nanopelagicales bacterium]
LGRVVDRFGKGLRSAPRDALIAASVPPSAFGRAFGFHRAGDNLGAVIGPLLGLLALSMLNDNLRAALWWAVIPAAISALLVLLVHEPKRTSTSPTNDESPPAHPAAKHSPLPKAFWRVTIVLVLISLVNFPDVLLLLRVMDLGFSTTQVVLAYVLFNLVNTLCAYPAGAMTDRWPRPYIYAVGLGAFAAGYLGLGLVDSGPGVFICIAVYGLFPAFTDGVGKAWISSLVTDEHRGRAQGVYQALTNGSIFIAGLWAGLMWTLGDGNGVIPLLLSGSVALIAALVMATARWWLRRPSTTAS